MKKPSVKRIAVSLATVVFGCAVYMIPDLLGCGIARKGGPPLSELSQWIIGFTGVALAGAGIGNVFRHPIIGALVAMPLFFAILVLIETPW